MDSQLLLWIVCSILGAAALAAWRWQIDRRRITVLEAALQLGAEPMVIFDERNKLVYLSPGLVIFDRKSAVQLVGRFDRPARGREDRGEVEIDGNRYQYRAKLLEYKPGRFGLVVILEYRRSVAAN
jgi:hypothetical protein